MIHFQENTQMSGGKDRKTLFHRILPATNRGLTTTTVVNWHLKDKDIEYVVGLTKNYCITVIMQKISSIHKLIQQILGSNELNGHAHFLPCPSKNHWNNFQLSWISTRMQKNQFLSWIHLWDTVKFRVLWKGWPHPSLTMPTPTQLLIGQLLIYVNLYQHIKIRLFDRFVLEIWLIKWYCNLVDR